MAYFPERPQDAYQLGDVQFDYASRRWYVMLIAPAVVRDFASALHVVESTALSYSYTILYFGKVRVQAQREAQDARTTIDDLLGRYVCGDVFMRFIDTLDMTGLDFDVNEEIRRSGWEGGHRESDDDDWMPF